MVHVWRSEENLVVLSIYLYVGPKDLAQQMPLLTEPSC